MVHMSENSSKLTQTKWLTRHEPCWALVSWNHLGSSDSLWIKTLSAGVCCISFLLPCCSGTRLLSFFLPKKQSLELRKKWQSLEIQKSFTYTIPSSLSFKYSCSRVGLLKAGSHPELPGGATDHCKTGNIAATVKLLNCKTFHPKNVSQYEFNKAF